MEFTFLTFKSSKPKPKTLAQRNKEFWLNELQCLFAVSGNKVVCVRGKDIECIWIESNGEPMWKTSNGHTESNPDYKPHYMISTHAGKEFELTYDSWLKCRYENSAYTENEND